MKVIIVEDNPIDQEILRKYISENSELELKGVFSNAIEAISVLKTLVPDIIFLDIEMPLMTGIEFLQSIKKVPQIIIVTSHKEYALDAFENDVTDFLMKPLSKARFIAAIEKAKRINEWLSLENTDPNKIIVRVDRENVCIPVPEITYIEAMGDYIKIQTTSEKFVVLSTMKSIGSKLKEEDFIRIHRSFLVSKNKIDSFKSSEVIVGEVNLPVSRAGYRELKATLK